MAILLVYCRNCTNFAAEMEKSYRQRILEYADENSSFSSEELFDRLKSEGMDSRNSMSVTLSRMVRGGELFRIAHGRYAQKDDRNVFRAKPTDKEQTIFHRLNQELPFAPFCIYNGNVLAPLQHHLSDNEMTYVETDRSATESVFNLLKKDTPNVWLAPDGDTVYRYINLSEGGIIVKPLITESPIETVDGVPSPTLEKLLVDIQKDADFSYLQGTESDRMLENARSLYNINTTRLNRYAKRRGLTV